MDSIFSVSGLGRKTGVLGAGKTPKTPKHPAKCSRKHLGQKNIISSFDYILYTFIWRIWQRSTISLEVHIHEFSSCCCCCRKKLEQEESSNCQNWWKLSLVPVFVWLSNAFDFLKFLYPKGKVSVEMRTPCGIWWPSPDGENRASEQYSRKRQ